MQSKIDDWGRPKSHMNEHGDLIPADLSGLYKSKTVNVIDHVTGYHFTNAKASSAYISFSAKTGVASILGNERVILDLNAFRKALKQGEVIGSEIIEHEELLNMVKNSNCNDHEKRRAIKYAKEAHELLVKGIVPARFLEIAK